MINTDILKQFTSLIEDEDYEITILSNAAAFLHNALDDVSWTGFYLYREDMLILASFQGKPACTKIALNKGVCGTCAAKKETLMIDNVHEFSGHIACDSASNSEIVIPLIVHEKLYGVLDIDSTSFARFQYNDKELLEACASSLCQKLSFII